MRINVYSQELITGFRQGCALTESAGEEIPQACELVTQKSNTGVIYSAVRLFMHSSEKLHHPPQDDDRSAITFWLPKSNIRRHMFAASLRTLANMVEDAPQETGLD